MATTPSRSSRRRIRVSSRATGERRFVEVYVYDTIEAMRAAASRFNPGSDLSRAAGVTQCWERGLVDRDGRTTTRQTTVIVRLARPRLGTRVIVHEMNHAAAAIYGSSLQGNELAIDLLHNHNETLAYLQSDLTGALVDRLYALGYYEEQSDGC